MRMDALSVAALAVAGLAVYAYAKPKAAAAAQTTARMPTWNDPGVTPGSDVGTVYAQATDQRKDNGAALSANVDYMQQWA